jgi:RHS repeat-associated protein
VGTGTPKVEYAYTDGSANHARLTSLRYPNGRYVSLGYGAVASDDDRLSRVASISGNGTSGHTEFSLGYTYLGAGRIVKSALAGHGLSMNLAHGTGDDPHHGPLDIFDRVVDLRWNIDGTLVERFVYSYDRAGNRLWRDNEIAASLSRHFDEVYQYDGLYQLTDFDRGNRGTGQTIQSGTLKAAQEWTLDPLGNWAGFKDDPDGSGWDLDQTRAHNKANETGVIGATVGTNWVDPVHDKAGNMTTIPAPNGLDVAFTCKYDAWNRLVEVKQGTITIATYAYDGLNRRVTATPGGGTARHFYYSRDWQVLEERVGAATTADRHFVWGLRYVDDLVLRTVYGTPSEALYAIQDANFNVTSVVDDASSPAVVERYVYTPYGAMTAYQPDFSSDLSSPSLEYRYAGYRFDTETGLMQVRNRYLHPQLGRWVTRDPGPHIGILADFYGYVVNAPPVFTDPFGLEAMKTGCAGLTLSETPKEGCSTPPDRRYAVHLLVTSGDLDDVVFDRSSIGEQGSCVQDVIYKMDDQYRPHKECGCVKTFRMMSHGTSDMIIVRGRKPGETWKDYKRNDSQSLGVATDLTGNNIGVFAREIRDAFCWCDPCDIFLMSCFAGKASGMMQQLADETGCTVTAPTGYIAVGPGDDLKCPVDDWYLQYRYSKERDKKFKHWSEKDKRELIKVVKPRRRPRSAKR